MHVELSDLQKNLMSYIHLAQEGKEVVVHDKSGKPIVELKQCLMSTKKRTLGGWKGKIKISQDFDAPLPQEFMQHFE